MDGDIEAFCLADQDFYETPMMTDIGAARFAEATAELPPGWHRAERGGRVQVSPQGKWPPEQGWRIRVSATPRNARAVLSTVWRHCLRARLAFVFPPGLTTLLASHLTHAPRSGGGTLVEVLPAEAQLEEAVAELGRILAEFDGPHIPGDLRWVEGPVHVNYGRFATLRRWDVRDRCADMLRDPAGALVPAPRGERFQLPAWVAAPEFLRPLLASRRAVGETEPLPYQIEQTLRQFGGGGLYRASDLRTGTAVLLKQARQHAACDASGADAATRLGRERAALTRLAGLACVPRLLDAFTRDGSDFLVLEQVPGRTLRHRQAVWHPLLATTTAPRRVDAYTAWAMGVHEALRQAVAQIHGRGLVLGELRPHDILVDERGGVRLIGFEAAREAELGPAGPHAAGRAAPPRHWAFEADRHALALLRVALFLPLATSTAFPQDRIEMLVEEITRTFPVPARYFATALRTLSPAAAQPSGRAARGSASANGGDGGDGGDGVTIIRELAAGVASWSSLRDGLARGIVQAATPERGDRLFPGAPAQFTTAGGGVNLATGAAGVLYALRAADVPAPPEHEDWLVRAADRAVDLPVGLYDGLHGVSHTLRLLGRRQDADRLLERALDLPAAALPTNVYSGIAGIGLHLVELAASNGDPTVHQAAATMVRHLANRLADPERELERPGLLYGWAGPALLFLRWHLRTGDAQLRALARVALRRDLQRCVTGSDGRLHAAGPPGRPPALATSGGLGIVLDEYLSVCEDEELSAVREAAIRAASSSFFPRPGLLHGRAGMLLCLTRQHRPAHAAAVAAHLRRLAWHLTPHQGGLAVPGPGLARLSTDLATGSAGVLLAVARAYGHTAADLPLSRRVLPRPRSYLTSWTPPAVVSVPGRTPAAASPRRADRASS